MGIRESPLEDLVMRDSGNFFTGKRVLITGDTGFKGSWLAFWLNELGAKVAGLALPPEGEDPLFARLGLNDLIEHHDGDIRDADRVAQVFDGVRPDIVFHLAAQALVRRSYAEPKTTFDTNVGGSVNILEAVKALGSVRTLIYVTSDKCYRNNEWIWGYRETDALGGRDPYSASKAAAEIVIAAYRDSFFSGADAPGIASVRAGNVLGGGDWAEDRILPDCIRALREGRPIAIRNPDSTRPWQHVLEPLSGYMLLAKKLWDAPDRFAGAWNFGPDADSCRSVGSLAERVVACWGSGEVAVRSVNDAPHEAGFLHLNTDKARHQLGWRPRWGLEDTIATTVGWYRDVLSGASPADVTRDHIRKFLEA